VLLVVGRVCQGVDVGSQTGRGRGVDSRDMVVDSDLFQSSAWPPRIWSSQGEGGREEGQLGPVWWWT
jgi:hypothetical protein